MGGGSNTSNTVQKADPWAGQQPYLNQIFQQAQQQYEDPNGPQYFQGNTVAAPGAATTQAQDMMTQAATGSQQTNQTAQQALQTNLNAQDVTNNPYLEKAITAAIQPAVDQFQDAGGTLSQIRTDAGNVGTGLGYGSRGDIATGLATDRFNKDILNTGATMASQAYGQGLQASNAALGMEPGVITAAGTPANQVSQVGAQQDQYQQALIDAAQAKWNYEQNLPGNRLAQYQNTIQGTYGGTGAATSSGYKPNALATATGTALTGASLYSMLAPYLSSLSAGESGGAAAYSGLLADGVAAAA